jgi:hypothetical protein
VYGTKADSRAVSWELSSFELAGSGVGSIRTLIAMGLPRMGQVARDRDKVAANVEGNLVRAGISRCASAKQLDAPFFGWRAFCAAR